MKSEPVHKRASNPLQRMFGTYLRLERKRLSLESKTVAKTLGLAETYYRLIESGGATFNQGLSFKLIGMLASANAHTGHTASQSIRFDRLALYLVGAQCIGADIAQRDAAIGSDLLAVLRLAEEDADFEIFHKETESYYSFSGNDENQRKNLEDIAAPAVARFLTTNNYVNPSDSDIVAQIISPNELQALPTLSVEIVARLVMDLAGRPFIHTPQVASNWENRNSKQIAAVEGIYTDASMIISEDNLKFFSYPYLEEKYFRKLRFIFTTSNRRTSAHSLKIKFISLLNSLREAADHDPVNEKIAKKIEFVVLSDIQLQDNQDEINKLLSRDKQSEDSNRNFNAYWSHTVTLGNVPTCPEIQHGFIGDGDIETSIWNLDLVEAAEKHKAFNSLWEKIN